jgi:predicted lipoprotein
LKPDLETLGNFRASYILAYKEWQSISMFEIGEAESLNLRSYTNLYPANTDLINSHIETASYNLELPSTFTAQGFPALDYLLFETTDQGSLLLKLQNEKYDTYLFTIIERLIELATKAQNGWDNDYQASFLSDRTSIDRLVNDFLFYYEKFLRAGKVGIPAGVFSGSPLSGNVEAPYSEIYSKELLLEALDAVIDFFNGESLDTYLKYMGKEDITEEINAYWESAKSKINALDGSLKKQAETDHIKLLEVYDELQKALVLLKVDMLQTLSIQVDYVDADGD